MSKIILPRAQWSVLQAQIRQIAPEIFDGNGHVLNLIEGKWGHCGRGKNFLSPVDGSVLCRYPMIDLETAKKAVKFQLSEFEVWSNTDLKERKKRVAECVGLLRQHQELLAFLLVWEIGKSCSAALVSVERCISGVEWYLEQIEPQLEGRKPLGVISNIASWNYPMSVLVHSILVQALCGNTVISKTPTDGGLMVLSLSMALARRCGLPVSLISGSGGGLSEALVRNEDIACLAFVGGKSNGRDIAASLYDRHKRYMLEMEGLNTYGIWKFSDWGSLAKQIKKGFDYGKQRCTAYVRYVIQRELFPHFLEMYLPLLKSLKCGHPLLVDKPEDPPPVLDFGPLVGAKAEQLRVMYFDALGKGAVSLFQGALNEDNFLPEQDISTYFAPAALLNPPNNSTIYYNEPFGPLDSIVIVDRIEQMVNEMNVSNGALVAAIACDDPAEAKKIAVDVRAFKVGINAMRSRGDKDEVFGGIGNSWKGAFVGGKYLVQAVTHGPPGEKLYGNFEDYSLIPEVR